ncbi:DoxX family membrane protein [Spirosoma sp. HMF4905]|uniref:DoxX family membrane protein n=1 Tax=Spirosoma arboris TaxID=2682092 RepID=A0A7K1SFR8_9BACT|nr:DoxX family protein [Spirosoma arboris]MVM32593.1 DoxX family membrane protein [Spirosoma arboris]
MKKFFSTEGILQAGGLTFIRIIVGLFLVYHGWEVFDAAKMKEYAAWDVFKQDFSPTFMVYLGKGSELLAGLLLTAGLFTRLACLLIMGTMLYITFFVGHGKFWYEDQHPFLFALLGLVFFFTGPGTWSVDALLERG